MCHMVKHPREYIQWTFSQDLLLLVSMCFIIESLKLMVNRAFFDCWIWSFVVKGERENREDE